MARNINEILSRQKKASQGSRKRQVDLVREADRLINSTSNSREEISSTPSNGKPVRRSGASAAALKGVSDPNQSQNPEETRVPSTADSASSNTLSIDPVRAKTKPIDSVHAKTVPTDSVHTKSVPIESAHTKSAPTESAHNKTVPTDSAHTKSVLTESAHTKTVPTDPVHTKSVLTESAHTKTVSTDSARTKSVPTDSAHTKTAPTETTHTKTVPTESAHTKAVPIESAHTKTAPTETTHTKPVPTESVHAKTELTDSRKILESSVATDYLIQAIDRVLASEMLNLSKNEIKVFLYIALQNFRDTTQISFKSIEADTGIPSPKSSTAMKKLVDKGMIEKRKTAGNKNVILAVLE